MAGKPEQIVEAGKNTRFKPGEVTNPNGRPKGVPNAATRLQRFLNLIQKGKNPVTKEDEEFTVAELMDLKQVAKALNGDTVAWDKINDRLEGKAMQRNENINVEVTAEEMDIITPDKLAALEKVFGDGTTDNKVQPVPGKRKGQG